MELYELPMIEVSEKIRTKEVSPVEVPQSSLARLEQVEPTLTAFATTTPELALEQAKRAEKEISDGNYRSPLHGIPLAVKDLYDTAGVRTTSSSAQRADHLPDTDSVSVAKLYAAGMVLIGKTHTHEFAYGATTPTTGNPWAPDRTPGGSSRASRVGVASLSWSLDHVGPLSRSVVDSALVMAAMSGYDRTDPGTVEVPVPDMVTGSEAGVAGKKIVIPINYYTEHVATEAAQAAETAAATLQALGADLVEVKIPMAEHIISTEWAIMMPEAAAYHMDYLRNSP